VAVANLEQVFALAIINMRRYVTSFSPSRYANNLPVSADTDSLDHKFV
jgi:hypothetical protein